ncbi:potassium/proton antiporter (CPA1 family) [Halospina denitrificans]|uniref:Potassium/proton antiporter (CPA1 family) n=1 Tax=Halospina denitrificans TaxID=332522 RepID=A0A4R7K004_9GAMM|nr:potassium/proton antiporter [Halospina denitrificans]TDT44131.1 potassium/proton antiporter (CPA1 family) [Halospina denitrificans]
MATDLLLFIGLLFSLSILLSPLSSRIGMPILLLFLGIGMLAGEDGLGGLQFDDFETAFLVGNLALALILLDGGLRTRAASFRVGLRPALGLATIGVLLTAGVTGLAAYWLFELPLTIALLMGAIVSSTDAAAVFSLLQGRGLHLNDRVSATLEIESGSNDPMAIFLTLVLLSLAMNAGDGPVLETLMLFVQQFGLGVVGGWIGGRVLAAIINRVQLVPAFYPLLVAAGGLVVFGGINALGGSGFLAIYLAGVILGNRRIRMLPAVLQMHDGLAWLAQMALFLILGLLATPTELAGVFLPGLAIAAILILVARPVAVLLTLWPFGFHFREQVFIGWVGLRGAVPIVLALFPVMAGVEHAHLLFNIAFCVVLVSLVVQGTTLAPLAHRLKLEVPIGPEPRRRLPLDLPTTGDHELMVFELRGERWAEPLPVAELKLPPGVICSGVFREGELARVEEIAELRAGDLVAVMASPAMLEDLSKVFDTRPRKSPLEDRQFFGEFVLNGDATVGDVELFYGIDISRYEPDKSLSACFRKEHGHPVVGDKLRMGPIKLVAKSVDGDEVTRVGLNLHSPPHPRNKESA